MQQLGACFFALFPIKAKERFLGTINCIGKEPRKLKPDEIRLINSMCDQIGVAVENINLFEEVKNKTAELESSNSDLREALEQQTATGEILRVIASSPTDLQPVLDTVVRKRGAALWRKRVPISAYVEGDVLRVCSPVRDSSRIGSLYYRVNPWYRCGPGMLVDRRTIRASDLFIILDVRVRVPRTARIVARQTFGVRTVLATPMLREETLRLARS